VPEDAESRISCEVVGKVAVMRKVHRRKHVLGITLEQQFIWAAIP
jgi:hypothetical protein